MIKTDTEIAEMKKNLIKTIRLKDSESIDLGVLSYELTKKNIMNGINIIYKESDLVHFLIENKMNEIDVNEKGELTFKVKNS
ncbi:hypothetical protein KDU74_01930 [Enterobacter cloacae]|uniref:hypothetical protein n=2 Tax=Enterobacterales TaxID=91347 RepID=UPI001BAB795D|nr:hypothetical protein [Enterobacter cloacae]QUG52544.1 hypothetical protein KDU74_01930 [Enterobacter cloacae]